MTRCLSLLRLLVVIVVVVLNALVNGETLDSISGDVHSIIKRGNVDLLSDKYDEKRVFPHTDKEKEAILNKHRQFRSRTNPEAADMEYMYWNDDLEYLAGLWASVCYWGHGLPKHPLMNNFESVGQNLWLGGRKPTGRGTVVAWHNNEIMNYDYETNECADGKACGHYTQVLWAKSKEVGCSRAFCPYTIDQDGKKTSKTNIWIEACHYAPSGNYVGVRPYKTGPSCSKCQSGSGQCYNNMCRLCSDHEEPCVCRQVCQNSGAVVTSDCRCSCAAGWYGADCSSKCRDKHKNCWKSPGWPGPGYCNKHPSIPIKCPLMCGLCVPKTTTEAFTTETPTKIPVKDRNEKTTSQKIIEASTTETPTTKPGQIGTTEASSAMITTSKRETTAVKQTTVGEISVGSTAEVPISKPAQGQFETTEASTTEVPISKPAQGQFETTEASTAKAKPEKPAKPEKDKSKETTACTSTSPLGMKDGSIPDSAIIASTFQNGKEARYGRLGSTNTWASNLDDTSPYILVDLGSQMTVSGIIIQGWKVNNHKYWVQNLKVKAGLLSNSLEYIEEKGKPQVFRANTAGEPTGHVHIDFPTLLPNTQFIRIEPTECRVNGNSDDRCYLRFEILGCAV